MLRINLSYFSRGSADDRRKLKPVTYPRFKVTSKLKPAFSQLRKFTFNRAYSFGMDTGFHRYDGEVGRVG
jgi:hypothetical protein